MRIIFDVLRDGLAAINTAHTQLAQAQQQLATGKRLNGASTDPLAAQQAIGERAKIGSADAYARTNQAAASQLAAADDVLSSMVDKLTAASVAAASARNTHSDATSRSAAAERVRGLRATLVSDMNTTFRGAHIFSGTNVNQPPYVQTGGTWTYQGNAAVVQLEVDRGRLISTTFDGRQIAQGADAADIFTSLDQLATAIEAGDTAGIDAGMAAIDRAMTRTQRAIGTLGADQQGVDEASIRMASLRRAAEIRRSTLEDANLAEAATRLTQADTAYRAALGAVSTAERQSLLDYLR